MGITVLAPEINESGRDFSVVRRPHEKGDGFDEQIRFGLGAVRNVGANAVDSILEARDGEGAFESLFSLCRRVDLKRVNKRTLEGLTHAGAFDSIATGRSRAQVMAAIDLAVEQGQSAQRDRESGQNSLFSLLAAPEVEYVEEYPDVEEWPPRQKLMHEREALGFYLTGHPLDRYQQDVDRHASCRIGDLSLQHHAKEVTIAGVLCDFKEIQTKSGKGPMCFFQLEDQFGRVEGIVFPKTYARGGEEGGETFGDRLQRVGDEPVFATGKIEVETDDAGDLARAKLLVEDVREIATVRTEHTKRVLLSVTVDQLTGPRLLKLKQIVANHAGGCAMELQVTVPGRYKASVPFHDRFGVTPSDNLMHALERLFGERVAQLA